MTGRATFRPRFEALGGAFQIREKVLVRKALAKLRNDRFEQLPHAEKLAAGLKEQVFVKKTIVEQRAGLFPIADHHAHESPAFRPLLRTAHSSVHCFPAVALL